MSSVWGGRGPVHVEGEVEEELFDVVGEELLELEPGPHHTVGERRRPPVGSALCMSAPVCMSVVMSAPVIMSVVMDSDQ